jgi:antitoxin ParD1/3/4
MKVNLTLELECFIQKAETSCYNSDSELVLEALGCLEEKEQLHQLRVQELRKRIARGLTSLDRGEAVDGDPCLDGLEGHRK